MDLPDLTLGQLQPTVAAAKALWLATGLSAEQVQALNSIAVQTDNLADTELGWEGGGLITIDTDAAGHGWFIDPTPFDNAEFVAGVAVTPAAIDQVDLLSVVSHEIGHALGYDDDAGAGAGAGVMAETLELGVRHVPIANASGTNEPGQAGVHA